MIHSARFPDMREAECLRLAWEFRSGAYPTSFGLIGSLPGHQERLMPFHGATAILLFFVSVIMNMFVEH